MVFDKHLHTSEEQSEEKPGVDPIFLKYIILLHASQYSSFLRPVNSSLTICRTRPLRAINVHVTTG